MGNEKEKGIRTGSRMRLVVYGRDYIGAKGPKDRQQGHKHMSGQGSTGGEDNKIRMFLSYWVRGLGKRERKISTNKQAILQRDLVTRERGGEDSCRREELLLLAGFPAFVTQKFTEATSSIR